MHLSILSASNAGTDYKSGGGMIVLDKKLWHRGKPQKVKSEWAQTAAEFIPTDVKSIILFINFYDFYFESETFSVCLNNESMLIIAKSVVHLFEHEYTHGYE